MHGGAALSFFRYERLVLGLGGINRAGTGAGAAIDAGIGIDDELAVTLGNSLNGAVAGASATGDAIIGDNICHDNSLLSNDGYVSILSHFCKNAMGDTQNLHFFHRVMSAMRFFRLSAAMVWRSLSSGTPTVMSMRHLCGNLQAKFRFFCLI